MSDPWETGRHIVDALKSARGGAFTGEELEQQFAVSPDVVGRLRAEYRIVYWSDDHGAFHYPKWQFDEAGTVISSIVDVLQTFKSQDEWRVMRYFLTPRQQLGGRCPLDMIRDHRGDEARAHVKLHWEENTW